MTTSNPMSTRTRVCILIAALLVDLVSMAATTTAQIRSWSGSFVHPDSTVHWYDAVAVPGGVTWGEAIRGAAMAGGHLATITSADENATILNLLQDASLWSGSSGPWIGGLRAPASRSAWRWNELEPFSFTAWADHQPANDINADRIHFGGESAMTAGTWANSSRDRKLPGFVIEYAGPMARRTIGLLCRDPGSFDGYTLFNPLFSKNTYLVDPRGRAVNTWTSSYQPGVVAYLLPSGNLLRSGQIGNAAFAVGGNGGIVEEFDWQGKLVWQFRHSSETYCLHHDVEKLPNGNILMIAWERKTKAEAIAAGRDPKLVTEDAVWPEKIIEVEPNGKNSGKIVWEWHVWDHLIQDFDSTKANYGDPAKHPELVDVNYTLVDGRADWLHANAVAYNPKLDQIILSVRSFCEIWVVDHATTTTEAASHSGGRSGKGGDLLYRWGNPAAYRGGTATDQTLFYQHDPHWIPDGLPGAGNILIFNNGTSRNPARDYSSVDEIVPPKVDAKGNYAMTNGVWGPTATYWSYTAPIKKNFFSEFVSGAQRLPNGNTLVCSGWNGWLFEVDAAGKTVWEYGNADGLNGIAHQGELPAGNAVFRSPRYLANYPGLQGKALTPREPIEKHGSVLLVEGSTLPHRVRPGTSARFSLRAGNLPGRGYVVATSVTPGLVQVDYRFVRLAWDPVLAASILQAAPTVFQNYLGLLDTTGRGSAMLAIPDNPALVGLRLFTAFLVVDPPSRSKVGMISNTVVVEIGS